MHFNICTIQYTHIVLLNVVICIYTYVLQAIVTFTAPKCILYKWRYVLVTHIAVRV